MKILVKWALLHYRVGNKAHLTKIFISLFFEEKLKKIIEKNISFYLQDTKFVNKTYFKRLSRHT